MSTVFKLTLTELAAVRGFPGYVRDLAQISELAKRAAEDLVLERGLRESEERRCDRMMAERNAVYDAHALGKLADELDEDNYASAAKALREAILMLDRAAKERALWVKLVEAERAYHDQTEAIGERTEDLKSVFGRVKGAVQALRDLGVPEDELP